MATRRTFATCVLVTSIACHMGIAPYSWIYFHYLELFRIPPQIWRIVTSFFLSSPQLGIVMDTYFVFQYASQLETAHPKFGRKEDFLWYLVFCGTVIIVRLPRQHSIRSVLSFQLPHCTPLISARIVKCLYCYHGSWKGGRLPLHFGRSVIRNT